MTLAFRGDPAVKADLLARIEEHVAAGTLRFGAQGEGTGYSPLAASTQGGDSADYARRFGYPLPLAGLLDPMMALSAPEQAVDHVTRWVSCVTPGADLSDVPRKIVEQLLIDCGAERLAARYHGELRTLYDAEAAGDTPPRVRTY